MTVSARVRTGILSTVAVGALAFGLSGPAPAATSAPATPDLQVILDTGVVQTSDGIVMSARAVGVP